MEYELPGEIVGSLFGMLTGNRIEREFRRSYEQLKRILEPGAAEPAPRPIRPVESLAGDLGTDDGRAEAAAI